MALTNTGAQEMLKGLLAGTRYLALFVGNNEVSGNGYAAKSTTLADWTLHDNGAYNTAQINFPNATGNWGDVTQIKICNHATNRAAANILWEISLSNNPDAITRNGTQVFIPAGSTSALRLTIPLT